MTAPLTRGVSGDARHAATDAPERAPDIGSGARRVLMVARDFPPTNVSGALRALKFTRYLSEHGWNTSVVTARAGLQRCTDPALLRQVPAECRVYSAFGFDTKAVLSIRNRYPRCLATPDRDISWFPHAVVSCLRVCRTEQPSVLLSTSPPVTAHCIGWAVQRLTKLPWVVELRDAWNLDTPLGPLSRRLDRQLERRSLMTADRIVVTTAALAEDLTRRFGNAVSRKITVVHNGYDEEAFAGLPPRPGTPRFRVTHTGQCEPPERDPASFLHALRRCLDREELPADVEVLFIGSGASFEGPLAAELRQLRLESNVRSMQRVPHAQALQAMFDSSLLLLLQDRDANRHSIPAKAYEYLRSRACILAVAPSDSATAMFLKGFPGVLQAAPAEPEQIARHLAEAYRRWKDAGGTLHFTRNVERYSGRSLATELARLLDELAAGPRANRRRAC